LKPNCPGMIIGRSSTNFLFFIPIGNPRWPPWPLIGAKKCDLFSRKNACYVTRKSRNVSLGDPMYFSNRENLISAVSSHSPFTFISLFDGDFPKHSTPAMNKENNSSKK
jgi:hypothetical protein